jgi:hypothetical protein
MAITYTLTLNIDQTSRTFLQTGGYSLYLFKGINAGSGASSAVWLTITGSNLYDEDPITVTWSENYYIGEDSSANQNGALINGTNAYPAPGVVESVALGKMYSYEGTGWDANPANAPSTDAFWILNAPSQVNNFYVSQQVGSAPSYIAVQTLSGTGGEGSFEPIETVGLIFSTQPITQGTIITQAFSAGATVTYVGSTAETVSWDMNTAWTANDNTQPLPLNASIYEALLGNTSLTQSRNAQKRALELGATVGTLASGKSHLWDKNSFAKLEVSWAGPAGTGSVSVKQDGAATSYNVPNNNIALVKAQAGKITNNTDKTISYTLS